MTIDVEPASKTYTIRIRTCLGWESLASPNLSEIQTFKESVLQAHALICADRNESSGTCRKLEFDPNVFNGSITPNFEGL